LKSSLVRAVEPCSGGLIKDVAAPLVLLHGLPLDARMWREQVAGLASAGTVLAPDLPGFGNAQLGAPDLADWAGRLSAWLRAQGIDRAAFAGCSMGGYTALALLRTDPALCAGFALINSKAAADSDDQRAARFANIERIRREGVGPFVASLIAQAVSPQTAERRQDVLAAVQEIGSAARAESVIVALQALAARPDSRALLAACGLPVAVIHGGEDRIIPVDEARSLAGAVPGATFTLVPEVGHFSPMESAQLVNDALAKFWQRV
jgi:pimeloyl-ACP methyl ester carboxylesterase